jgi:glycosyltransferase involved in cell wall biosynthesis
MRVSVILATYNQPRWLEKVLWGYAAQTHRDFQLLIADDGSGADTAAVVQRARAELGLRPVHVWHEDRGHRKCEILNRAVLAADGDYLVFSDGDCIPRNDFVQTHATLAEAGRFLSGGALRLPRGISEAISRADVESGSFADGGWLAGRGWEPGRQRLRLLPNGAMAAMLDRLTPTGASWNGGNASTWRDAVVAVNGFDHDMQYGGQDRAFGERLENQGYRGKQIRHRAVCVHLEHDRPYRTEESIRRNRAVRDRIRRERETRAPEGLAQLATRLGHERVGHQKVAIPGSGEESR